MSRGTKAVINYDNLRHNFKILSKLAPSKLILVVKADAYGHGLKHVVKALDNVDCFAVATIDEALLVRKYNSEVRILLLEGFLNNEELTSAYKYGFDCVIHQQLQLDLFDLKKTDKKINIWLKYDSGMNRLGFNDKEFDQAINCMEQHINVDELILMTHFASADDIDGSFSQNQINKFKKYFGKYKHPISLSNSSALLNNKQINNEWCRVGLALFGVSPIKTTQASDYQLKPVMSLKTNIISIKSIKAGQGVGYSQSYTAKTDRTIAIIGIGYGDGYPWSLSGNAVVKINDHTAKIIGKVSMDMMTIDITNIKGLQVGDSVLVWGGDNDSLLPLEIVASNAQTIPYVLLCQITSRVHYHYV